MTKLTRKLFISLLTVAFAVVTLGTTTFAWFTLNNTAEINAFDGKITGGTGIEISLDNTKYKNIITSDEINALLTGKYQANYTINALTTTDGIYLKDLNDDTSDRFIEFPLYFRSPATDAEVYLLSTTATGSTGVLWKPDTDFQYGEGTTRPITTETDPFLVYAANSLRMSFEPYTLTGTFEQTASGIATIYELDPTLDGLAYNNLRLDQAVKTYGMKDYYEKKLETTLNPPAEGFLPVVKNNLDLTDGSTLSTESPNNGQTEPTATTPILTLSTSSKVSGQTFYYGMIMVRVWLEGWDPDCFNAVLGAPFQVALDFGGYDPKLKTQP